MIRLLTIQELLQTLEVYFFHRDEC